MFLLFVNIKLVHIHWCKYCEFELGHEMVATTLAYTCAMVALNWKGLLKLSHLLFPLIMLVYYQWMFLNGNGVFKCVKLSDNRPLHLTHSC